MQWFASENPGNIPHFASPDFQQPQFIASSGKQVVRYCQKSGRPGQISGRILSRHTNLHHSHSVLAGS
jgi:hypothetical protein